MSDERARELRRRRRRYEWEARFRRYTSAWAGLAHAVFFRLPPGLRTRLGPRVVMVAGSILAGAVAGATYWALAALGVKPVVFGLGVTLALWFPAAVGALFRRFWRVESGHVPPPPLPGGGVSGVREPRRPSPNPKTAPVEKTEPTDKEA